ncbi:uncharacterized protein LOC141620750 [Silene latifolia]|uniref:uncharacterized protein LOC141620750 n=1 Tax=Silene latifolia TaxID=37657 RepID=UPI003D7778C1
MRLQAGLPLKFWGACLLTATYLINKMPTPILKWKTPFEMLFGEQPKYDELKILGSLCYASMPVTHRDKFAKRARKCIFIGYPFGEKGYKLYDLETHTYTAVDPTEVIIPASESTAGVAPRKIGRPRKPSSRLDGYQLNLKLPFQASASATLGFHKELMSELTIFAPDYIASLNNVLQQFEPNTYFEAQQDDRWLLAMSKELKALEANNTWELTYLPANKNVPGLSRGTQVTADIACAKFVPVLTCSGYL